MSQYPSRIRQRQSPNMTSSASSAITQPTMQTTAKKERAQQITILQKELEHIKDKMKEAENNQAKMLEKIHNNYNFKKKQPHTEDHNAETTPIIYFEKQDRESIDGRSQKSDQSEFQYRMSRQLPRKSLTKKQLPNYNQSMEYMRSNNEIEISDSSSLPPSVNTPLMKQYSYSPNPYHQEYYPVAPFGIPYHQVPIQYPVYRPPLPPNLNSSQAGSVYVPQPPAPNYISPQSLQSMNNFNQGEDLLAREREKVMRLNQELSEKELEIYNLRKTQKRLASYTNSMEEELENGMEEFMQEVVKRNLHQIEKACRKNENKVKNLAILLRDCKEQRQSSRLINEHRRHRERSLSRRDISPGRAPGKSTPSKASNQSKKEDTPDNSKHFQEVAKKYEEIIQVKNKELIKMENQLRAKEKELIEIQTRMSGLQLQLKQAKSQGSFLKSSVEENLLDSYMGDEKVMRKLKTVEAELANTEMDLRKALLKISQLQGHKSTNKLRSSDFGDDGQKTIASLQKQLEENTLCISNLEIKCKELEKVTVEKQCARFSTENKFKQLEAILASKNQKILQLESMIQSGENFADLLEKSQCFDGKGKEAQKFKEDMDRYEDELEGKNQEILDLMRYVETANLLQKQVQSEVVSLKRENEALALENERLRGSSSRKEEDKSLFRRNAELEREIKQLRQDGVDNATKFIKLNTEIDYMKDSLSERETKYEKQRKELEEHKALLREKEAALTVLQGQMEAQRREHEQKLYELHEDPENELTASRNISDKSGFMASRISAQVQLLQEKLREANASIETQHLLQQKVVDEYRQNLDRVKLELKEKSKAHDQLMGDIEKLRGRLSLLEQEAWRGNGQIQSDSRLISQQTRIEQLQRELTDAREINERLTEMEQELFVQITEKQEEKNACVKTLNQQNQRIQELEDLLQLKEMNMSGRISSSISKSKRQTLKSHNSLRYSVISQQRDKGIIDFELSEANQSFFDQSLISNISEMFGKEELQFDRVHFKRNEQVRLFEKTAAYIKSLKKAIEQKSKKIKLLERKIESLRNSELIRKDIYEVKQPEADLEDCADDFRDYYSVQMGVRENSRRNTLNTLEHEARLAIEENNLLMNQIESMQDQLQKAEEQQNSLVKIKDLYKEEIKKLIKKNEEQTKMFEDEIRNERRKVEESQAVHNMETLKQLFLKIMEVMCALDAQGLKSRRRQERKRELGEFLKIYCSLVHSQSLKDKILAGIAK